MTTFAYFRSADDTGEIAVNTDKVVVLKNVRRRKYNTLIVCDHTEIEVIGKVAEIAGEIVAASGDKDMPS